MGDNDGAAGNWPHTEDRVNLMGFAVGKNTGTVVSLQRGTDAGNQGGSSTGKLAQNSSDEALPKIGRQQLIREWQCAILPFPVKQSADEQDATDRAVESQRNGESACSLLAAVNQARANPRVRAALARLIGVPGHYGDPDFMEAWELFMACYARQQRRAEEGPAEACDQAMGDLFGGVQH